MNQTPRGLRPHIILAGRCNSGKSSLLNALSGNEVAIVSAQSGTTTDPVFKNMELLPFGPVTFVDTPGLDDDSELGNLRTLRSRSALGGGDLILWISRPSCIVTAASTPPPNDAYHPNLLRQLAQAGLPDHLRIIVVLTHADLPEEAAAAGLLSAPRPVPANGAKNGQPGPGSAEPRMANQALAQLSTPNESPASTPFPTPMATASRPSRTSWLPCCNCKRLTNANSWKI